MPELPEVFTTASQLNRAVSGRTIASLWNAYNSPFHVGKPNIKNPLYFLTFKEEVEGREIVSVGNRGKNVLIHLSGGSTILVHMKMTGHLLHGRYVYGSGAWRPQDDGPLADPMNGWVRLVLALDDGTHIALSDKRRFAKVTLIATRSLDASPDLVSLGPDPLAEDFALEHFTERLMRHPTGKIKHVLMDQEIIAGIGNIYSDEMLWRANIHPLSTVAAIPEPTLADLYTAMRATLSRGIELRGDSMSDYRNVNGEKGGFQETHRAYRLKGERCSKPECPGTIERTVVGARNAHFCGNHQTLYASTTALSAPARTLVVTRPNNN